MPFLSEINMTAIGEDRYPFNIGSLRQGLRLRLKTDVCFFVGENGSGKSTLLEAVAGHCGFNLRGGNRNHNGNTGAQFSGYESPLTPVLKLVWTPRRITQGFFMRAESFFNFAAYIDEMIENKGGPVDSGLMKAYGGKYLHRQSHGESFLSLFQNQFESGIYILDEPEAALSPSRILAFISIIDELAQSGQAQFLVATHSPMLLCYPRATIYQFDDDGIHETHYQDTSHYQLTKSFLENPSAYLRHLLNND